MHLHFERTVNARSDCSILSLTWMGKVPDELPEDEGWKLNRTNYYQEGWLATGNVRGIVGVTFTTSHCKKNVEFPLRTNYNLRGHRSEVILVKWNEPYQKLASCDSSGIIFVWIKYEGRWSIELINDRNTPVTHFSWSHDGRMALICYQDGFVLVGSVAGQRYWSSMLNLEATITCGIWTPDDQQVYFGTTSGQIIVMDVHGAMVSQVQLSSEVGIISMAWSCEKFKMEESDDNDSSMNNTNDKKFILAVCLQNGFIFLLKTFDDVSPIQIDTGLQGPLCMEWSNSRELLAVSGVAAENKTVSIQLEYVNMLKFYNDKGVLLQANTVPFTQAPVSALTWGHNDKRLFLATGTKIHIAWVSRRIASLQLLCRLKIYDSIQYETQLPALPLPARIRNLIGNLFAQTIRCCVPEPSALREFVSRPPNGSVRLHCTMIRHDDDNNLSSGTCYTLYLEYLGGLVPLLKGKRTSKIRPEFVIFDPQVEDLNFQWSPESKSSTSSSQSTSGGGVVTDSSDSDRDEGCNSPRMPRRRKRKNKQNNHNSQNERQCGLMSSDLDPEDLAYVDTLPEHVRLVEVTSNIWGTKFKIHGLVTSVPANLGQVTYKTSLLHLQPRQMTLVITELRDDFPVEPDPNFNPNLFSEDEEEVVHTDTNPKYTRMSIDNCPPIAPMSPRGNRLTASRTQVTTSYLTPNAPQKNGPVLGRPESLVGDGCPFVEITDIVSFCDSIRPNTSSKLNCSQPNNRPNSSTQSTSFVGQFNRNGNGTNANQRHAVSPLCCEGSVPALQSPKNAVAPSDIIFDRPPAQTLISYTPSDYSNASGNVQQIKSNILSDHARNGLSFGVNPSNDHQRPILVKKVEVNANGYSKLCGGSAVSEMAKGCIGSRGTNNNESQKRSKLSGQQLLNSCNNKELRYIDKDHPTEPLPGPSTSVKLSTTPMVDSMVRSCSVGYLDMVDAQLVPCDVALLILKKDMPKRLVLVNKKPKTKRQSRHLSRQGYENYCRGGRGSKLKNCGKSKSLDSSDIFPSCDTSSIRNIVKIERVIPETTTQTSNKSSSSSPSDHTEETVVKPIKRDNMRLGIFASKSPLLRRRNNAENDPQMVNEKKIRSRSKQKNINNTNSVNIHSANANSANGLPLHSQALANLEKLITRLREDDSRSSAPNSPRLPRSSPASPAPCKKGKRPQSASPIRKNLLSSPLLGRRKRNKNQESSDDEIAASGDEIFSCTNYKDLETFQKAQLRQKLKRGKVEPNGSSCNNHPIPQRRQFVMHNKAPMWNENSQVYQLDFGGRVTQESAKNFQIEFRGKQVMQFGRIDGNAYTLDFQYPFSALQAFAVALANVTQRLK